MLYARTRTSGGRRAVVFAAVALTSVLMPAQSAGSMETSSKKDTSVSTSASAYGFKSAEICFMRKINQRRINNGLRALRWDKQMGYVARRHARQMATNRAVYHDPNMGGEITRWRRLGQNTGAGQGCKGLFRSFMRSSSHRANILGHWRFIGVGTETSGGKLYVQQIFENYENPGNVYHWP